jgi:hypothetical protein
MSDKYDDSEERVRKYLHDLPRVKAKPDFEQRLARKLAEPAPPTSGMFAWLNASGRIPLPVYSAAALVLLAIVSYYAFFRSGALPTPPITSDEISSEPAAPLDKPTGPSGKDEVPVAGKVDEHERGKQASGGDQKRKEAVYREQKPAEPVQRQQAVELSQERGLTQQSAQGVSMSRLKKGNKEVAAEESVRLQEAPATAPTVNAAPGQKAFAPQAQAKSVQAAPYAVTVETFRAALDSVHIKDSLRADSLRKAKLDSLKRK